MVRENKFLEKAKKSKNDEFYTLLVDIEKELKYYKKFLKVRLFFVIVMILMKVTFLNILL